MWFFVLRTVFSSFFQIFFNVSLLRNLDSNLYTDLCFLPATSICSFWPEPRQSKQSELKFDVYGRLSTFDNTRTVLRRRNKSQRIESEEQTDSKIENVKKKKKWNKFLSKENSKVWLILTKLLTNAIKTFWWVVCLIPSDLGPVS